jgi:K+-sensing histidine kinase KdpD
VTNLDDPFLEVVAHELRTPVTTIYAASAVIAANHLGPVERRAVARDLAAEAERLYRLVEDLLVLGRADRARLWVDQDPIPVSRVVRAVIQREHRLLEGHEIAFSGPSDVVAEGDEGLIRHVLRNLLDNAVRYAPPRGLIEVVVAETASEIVVRVLDDGSHARADGTVTAFEIAPDQPATTAQRAGAGLGLYVAGRLVEAMDGRTWAGSRDHRGTEFGFSLPRQA